MNSSSRRAPADLGRSAVCLTKTPEDDMMSWIRRLFSRSRPDAKQEPPSYTLICSACYSHCSGSDAHVIPWWNPDQQSIFTTYRCGTCWLPSLKESQAAVSSKDPAVIASFCDFLARHGYQKDADAIQSASPEEARAVLLMVIDAVRDERIRFSP